jgi:hypothetical protein
LKLHDPAHFIKRNLVLYKVQVPSSVSQLGSGSKNDPFFGSVRHYKPQGSQPFALGEHAASGALYSFNPDSDTDYHSTTDIDFM